MKRTIVCALGLVLLASQQLLATPKATAINVKYRNGQAFITWTNTVESPVLYKVYRKSGSAITDIAGAGVEYLGTASENSATNPRTFLPGQPATFRLKSDVDPLATTKGFFVATTPENGTYYYAVTVLYDGTEYTTLEANKNSTATGVVETVADPQPVLQCTIVDPVATKNNVVHVYTQFLTGKSQPAYPIMTNAGCFPVCFALTEPPAADTDPSKKHPLIVRMHTGYGNYTDHVTAKLPFNTWQLALDDFLPNSGGRTGWFGYHENFDITSDDNANPLSGIIRSYTLKRIMHSLDWTLATFNIADSMVYLDGGSMGAAGALTVAMVYPDRFAAATLSVPKMNFAELLDWQGLAYNFYQDAFDTAAKRAEFNTYWGTVATNLETDVPDPADAGETLSIYEVRDCNVMATRNYERSLPIIFAVNGRSDDVVGWTEKLAYYNSVNTNRLGGHYFWDNRAHTGNTGRKWASWEPDLLRYNLKLSYPAFSNCSINEVVHDGNTEDPDYGSINGFLDWEDASIVDKVAEWRITLQYRADLKWYNDAGTGTIPATPGADICTADVTLRRLQKFGSLLEPGDIIHWKNRVGGVVVQDVSFEYTDGTITLLGVEIHKTGNDLKVWITDGLGGGDEPGLE